MNDDEPSEESLREIPEIDFTKAVIFGRGKEGIGRARAFIRAHRAFRNSRHGDFCVLRNDEALWARVLAERDSWDWE